MQTTAKDASKSTRGCMRGCNNMPNEDAGDNSMFAVCRCKDMHAAIFMRQHMPTMPQLWGWVVVDDKTTATANRNRKAKPQEGFVCHRNTQNHQD